jgi:UPF0271 protein
MLRVDLNSDLGESFGSYKIGNDDLLLKVITSANVACGFHGGDPIVMDRTVKLALELGVKIGAHPGYPDISGFGRRYMEISCEEARAYILYQIGALNAFVKSRGGRLNHVKLHGALYNAAAKDYKLSKAITEAVFDLDSSIIFVGLANSEMIRAAEDTGLKTLSEVFADRAYNRDGSLVSRKIEGSLIKDVNTCIDRVVRMIREGRVLSIDGCNVEVKADTVCIHGDNAMALEFAKALREGLVFNKIKIGAMD